MKTRKHHKTPRATYGGGWLVATRTGNPPKGFQRKEVFEFPTKRDALSFIRDIEKNNVEWMLGEARGTDLKTYFQLLEWAGVPESKYRKGLSK